MSVHALALLIEKSISCTTTTTATAATAATTTTTRRQRDTAKCKMKKKEPRRKYKAGEDMGKSLCDILRCADYDRRYRNLF